MIKKETGYTLQSRVTAIIVLMLSFSTTSFAQEKDTNVKTGIWKGEQVEYVAGEINIKRDSLSTRAKIDSVINEFDTEIIREFNVINWGTIKVSNKRSIFDIIKKIKKSGAIEDAEPNLVVETFVTSPNDEHFSKQWGLVNTSSNEGTADSDIDADVAWENLTTGNSDAVIAVLDSGIPMEDDNGDGVWDVSDLSHEDLDDGSKFILGSDHTGDGNGVRDEFGHGTHVTGIASAETDNGDGVAGVCWDCKVLAIQVIDADGFGDVGTVSGGILEAVDYDVNNSEEVVISASLGFNTGSSELEDAIVYARNNGVPLIVAAGNARAEENESDGTDCSVHYPAAYSNSYSNVVAVASTNPNDDWSFFSCTGSELDVAAPGGDDGFFDSDDIFSTYPNYPYTIQQESVANIDTTYDYQSGTSMATPMVAGTVGLMLSLEPGLSPSEIKEMLGIETAEDVNGGGFDNKLGHGRLNAFNAVTFPAPPENLTITNAGQTNAHPNLDWDDNVDPDLDHYNVFRCTSHYTSCNWSKIAQTTTSDYTDTFVIIKDKEDANDEYSYYVSAVDANDFESDQSNFVSTWGTQPLLRGPDQEDENPTPAVFALHAPAPNPVASQTTVQVDVPETKRVTVTVYDVLGRQVAQMADRTMTPGFHPLSVHPDGWPSGVYFVRMRAGTFTATERLTVVR